MAQEAGPSPQASTDTMAKRTMTTRQDRPEIERLKALVEVHGGDRERWPASERLAMERLAATDAHAASIVAQARALDRMLDAAPALSSDQLSDLANRIIAAAQSEGRWQGGAAGNADAIVGGAQSSRSLMHDRAGPLPPRTTQGIGRRLPAMLSAGRRGPLASVGMLAASLLVGVLIGLSLSNGDVVSEAQVVADAGDESVFQQLVMGEESLDALVEDLL